MADLMYGFIGVWLLIVLPIWLIWTRNDKKR